MSSAKAGIGGGYNHRMTTLSFPMRKHTPVLAQAAAALAAGVILYVGLVLAWVIGYQLLYAGRIFPGISVAGVDLSGMAPEAAAAKLSQALSYPISGKVLLRDGDKVWSASPAQMGMVFDASTSAQAAYRMGRGGGLFQALGAQVRGRGFGFDVAPVVIFDQRVAHQYLEGLAAQIDQPVIEAGLQIDGSQVSVRPAQPGRALNIDATIIYVSAQLQSFRDGEITMIVNGYEPAVRDVSSQAEAARSILTQPLVLQLPQSTPDDPGPWVYDIPVISKLVKLRAPEPGPSGSAMVVLDPVELSKMLKALEPEVDRNPHNARFHFFNGELIALQASVTGRRLDVEASVSKINEAVAAGQHTVSLAVEEQTPDVPDTATAAELGITQLLPGGAQTSYFRGFQRSAHPEHRDGIGSIRRRVGGPRGDVFHGRGPGRRKPGQRLHGGADHLWGPNDQGRGRRSVPGEHNAFPNRFHGGISDRGARSARLPGFLL